MCIRDRGKIALKLKPEIEAKAKANMSAGGQAYHPSEELSLIHI